MAELDDNALVTLEETKIFLEQTGDEQDQLIEMLINSVSTFIDNYTGRNLIEATYTDLELDGNGEAIMYLPNWPVVSASITEDDIALTEGKTADYLLYKPTGKLNVLLAGQVG